MSHFFLTLSVPRFLDDSYVSHRPNLTPFFLLLLLLTFSAGAEMSRRLLDGLTDSLSVEWHHFCPFGSAQFVESRSARHRLPAAIFQGDPLSQLCLSQRTLSAQCTKQCKFLSERLRESRHLAPSFRRRNLLETNMLFRVHCPPSPFFISHFCGGWKIYTARRSACFCFHGYPVRSSIVDMIWREDHLRRTPHATTVSSTPTSSTESRMLHRIASYIVSGREFPTRSVN